MGYPECVTLIKDIDVVVDIMICSNKQFRCMMITSYVQPDWENELLQLPEIERKSQIKLKISLPARV